jgi:hypothetical protein
MSRPMPPKPAQMGSSGQFGHKPPKAQSAQRAFRPWAVWAGGCPIRYRGPSNQVDWWNELNRGMEIQNLILKLIQIEPGVRSRSLCIEFGIYHSDLKRLMRPLVAEGWISREKKGWKVRWYPTGKELLL